MPFRNLLVFARTAACTSSVWFYDVVAAGNRFKKSLEKSRFKGNIPEHVIATGKTVSGIIAEFERHDLSFFASAMLINQKKPAGRIQRAFDYRVGQRTRLNHRTPLAIDQVKAIQVHHLVPSRHKVIHKFLL